MGKPQMIATEGGEELVVLSRRDYDALLAQAGDEQAEDRMTLLVAAEARSATPLPAAVSSGVLAGASVLEAVRRWRGLDLEALAAAAGLETAEIVAIEGRECTPSPATAAALARALDVPIAWLV